MPENEVLGNAVVPVSAPLDQLDRDLARARQKTDKAMGDIGTRAKKSMRATSSKLAGLFTIGGGIGMQALFGDLDAGLDSIQAKTGATGGELDGLRNSLENVAGDSPASIGHVGDVMGELAARTGLVGPPLEELTETLLGLEKLKTGANVETLTRLYGDWGVAADEMTEKSNRLLRLQQETGVGIDRISDLATRVGSPMRQLGYGFEETTALMARFESEGVNTQLVLGGIRQALGTYAQAQANSKTATAEATREIEQLRAKQETAADRIASTTERLRDQRARVTELRDALQDARDALNDALTPPSADDMRGSELGIERSRLAEADAADAVADAERRLAELRADPAAEAHDIADAERALASAQLGTEEAALRTRDAERALAELRKVGTEQDDAVVAARDRITDASKRLTEAQRDAAGAERDVADARADAVSITGQLAQAQADLAAASVKLPPLEQWWSRFVDSIKDAPDVATAQAIALKVMGKEATPDFVAAVRENRFETDALVDSMINGTATVDGMVDGTESLTDELAKLRNKVATNVGPWGEWAGVIGSMMGGLTLFTGGLGTYTAASGAAAGGTSLLSVAMAALPFVAIAAAVAGLAYLIYRNWDSIKRWTGQLVDWVGDRWRGLLDFFGSIPGWISDRLSGMWSFLQTGFATVANGVIGYYEWMLNKLIDGLNWAIQAWNDANLFLNFADISKVGHVTLPRISSAEEGARTLSEGLLLVHPGELVVPAAEVAPYEGASRGRANREQGGGVPIVVQAILDGKVIFESNRRYAADKRRGNVGSGLAA